MLNHKNMTPENSFGFAVLALVFLACTLPLTLSFLPQLLAILCLPYLWKSRTEGFSFITKKHILGLMVLPALGLVSSLWSIMPDESLSRALKVGGIALSYSFFLMFILNLPSASLNIIKKFFYVPILIAGCYLSIELTCGLPFMHLFSKNTEELHGWLLNKNVAVFVLFFPVAFLSLRASSNKALYALLAIPLIVTLMYTDSQASWLSLIAMVGAGLAIYFSSSLLKLFWLGLSAIVLFMPLVAPYMYQYFAVPMGDSVLGQASFSSRLEIWDFVSNRIIERPFLGFGLDTTRYMVFDNPGLYHPGNTVMHPHNAVLQLWSDFGIFGIIIVMASLMALLKWILKQDKSSQIICGTLISGLLIFLLVSWSLWASWLLGFIFFIAIITLMFCQNAASQPVEEVSA